MYYRGYILIRLKTIGTEWKVVDKLTGLKSNLPEENWEITYITPIYGGWDIIVECSFTKLHELDRIVSYIRMDENMSNWIEETTTLVSSKADYPEF
ncbi:MAG: hypothetical protein ACFFKA_02050 [Candidatus Thorarchaeota archaeon]